MSERVGFTFKILGEDQSEMSIVTTRGGTPDLVVTGKVTDDDQLALDIVTGCQKEDLVDLFEILLKGARTAVAEQRE